MGRSVSGLIIQWGRMSGGLVRQLLPLFQLDSTPLCRKTLSKVSLMNDGDIKYHEGL